MTNPAPPDTSPSAPLLSRTDSAPRVGNIVAGHMADLTDKMNTLTTQMNSITDTIGQLDQQLPTIVENTTDIPGRIGGLPLDQTKRGLATLRRTARRTDTDTADDDKP